MCSTQQVLLSLLWLAGAATARKCTNMTVPVTASAHQGVFGGLSIPQTPIEVTGFISNQTRQGTNLTAEVLTGYATVAGLYNISVMYCVPDSGSANTLQILTHGYGFDKVYWDLPYHAYNYSYIATAVDTYGYATLSYDRLGIGNSSHGNPLDEIQITLGVAALANMTMMLRNGTFPGVNSTFDKIVHVGHSFGSTSTYLLTALYPNISDGMILTAYSTNGTFMSYSNGLSQANLNQPLRFGSLADALAVQKVLQTYQLVDFIAPVDLTTLSHVPYVDGYLATSDTRSSQYLFLHQPYFDPGILYYYESIKQPIAIGEMLSTGVLPAVSAFAGPVLVIDGQYDLPFCGGDCLATGGALPSIPADVQKALPAAKNFEAVVHPNSGHGINLAYNATGAYRLINDYLRRNVS